MRFAAAAFAAAMIGLVEAKGKVTKFATKSVANTKKKLEKIHGKGLTGLYDLQGQWRPERLGKSMKPLKGGQTASFEGSDVIFNLDGWEMAMLGAFQGFTYSDVQGENAVSNCFYAAFEVVDNVNDIKYIFQHANDDAGSYKWWSFAIEEPINLILNFSVTYQMCDFTGYMNIIQGWANLDISAFASDITEMVINGVMDIPTYIDEWKQIQCEGTCSCEGDNTAPEDCEATVNAYEQGMLVGKAITKFFGTQVAPVIA